ncbi:MAG: HAD family hydrolase [Lachnospiraceae bacterium]
MQEIKLVIFDFDGVIMDTEWAHAEAKKRICAAENYILEDDLSLSVGYSNEEFWKKVITANGVQESPHKLAGRQYNLVLQILEDHNQRESKGLTFLLNKLKEMGKKLVICSGSDRYFIVSILERLEIEPFFDHIMGGDDIEHLKPAPDIFLRMLEKTGTCASNAIVIEDSASGCTAARDAGIRCLGYTNQGKNLQNLEMTEGVVDELQEVLNYIS